MNRKTAESPLTHLTCLLSQFVLYIPSNVSFLRWNSIWLWLTAVISSNRGVSSYHIKPVVRVNLRELRIGMIVKCSAKWSDFSALCSWRVFEWSLNRVCVESLGRAAYVSFDSPHHRWTRRKTLPAAELSMKTSLTHMHSPLPPHTANTGKQPFSLFFSQPLVYLLAAESSQSCLHYNKHCSLLSPLHTPSSQQEMHTKSFIITSLFCICKYATNAASMPTRTYFSLPFFITFMYLCVCVCVWLSGLLWCCAANIPTSTSDDMENDFLERSESDMQQI